MPAPVRVRVHGYDDRGRPASLYDATRWEAWDQAGRGTLAYGEVENSHVRWSLDRDLPVQYAPSAVLAGVRDGWERYVDQEKSRDPRRRRRGAFSRQRSALSKKTRQDPARNPTRAPRLTQYDAYSLVKLLDGKDLDEANARQLVKRGLAEYTAIGRVKPTERGLAALRAWGWR
jgi:hypothetical protein